MDRALRLLPGLVLLACLAAAGMAGAQPRLALVVGNGRYESVPSLDNPPSDAGLMAGTLEQAGFEVTLLQDADLAQLSLAIARFGRDLRAAGDDATGLFYYAGHGVQSFGTNYLLPTDVELTDAADLSLVGIDAEAVLRQMYSARNRTNIVILDACRDNPFVRFPDLDDNGLAEMKAPTGTFLAYATAPGQVALDGTGGNSPFTQALARNMTRPGLAIEQLFKTVRIEVIEETGGRQVPWDTSSLTRDFSFVEQDPASAEEIATRDLWDSVRASRDPIQILLFIRSNPGSELVGAARSLLAEVVNEDIGGTATEETAETAPAPAPAPAAPKAREQELVETARQQGSIAGYEAYLSAYPDGTYAELARFEVSVLRDKAAAAAPAAPGTESAALPQPAAPQVPPEAMQVTFAAPLTSGGEAIVGKSIEELIQGSPLFPPVENLPESYWKSQTCSNCHSWTREALCTQAQTYLAEDASRALGKEHPLGGGFKRNLRAWAANDCR